MEGLKVEKIPNEKELYVVAKYDSNNVFTYALIYDNLETAQRTGSQNIERLFKITVPNKINEE